MLSEMLTEDYALQWIRIVTTALLDMLIMITANMLVTMQGKRLFLFLSSGEVLLPGQPPCRGKIENINVFLFPQGNLQCDGVLDKLSTNNAMAAIYSWKFLDYIFHWQRDAGVGCIVPLYNRTPIWARCTFNINHCPGGSVRHRYAIKRTFPYVNPCPGRLQNHVTFKVLESVWIVKRCFQFNIIIDI